MAGQQQSKQSQQRSRSDQQGIPAAAIEGAAEAKASPDADKLAQPGPGLSDEARESNASAQKRNPDVEKFQDGSNASPDDFEWEVLEE